MSNLVALVAVPIMILPPRFLIDGIFGMPFHVSLHGRLLREAHLADRANVRTLA